MHDLPDQHDHCISICNELLRSELSAVEKYGQVIDKFTHSPTTEMLRLIRRDHAHSANLLSANVRGMNGEPRKDSGALGIAATVVQRTVNLFGPESAIESLIRGEEADRKEYQDALLDEDVMPDCKKLIRESLLPPVLHHVSALERLETRNNLDS